MTEFRMGDVCARLKAIGIAAYVEQTGGGCATIYVGEPVPVTETYGVRMGPNGETETRTESYETHAVMGGPGSYNWTDPDASVAWAGDFSVGTDNIAWGSDDCPYELMPDDCPDPVSWATERLAYYLLVVWPRHSDDA